MDYSVRDINDQVRLYSFNYSELREKYIEYTDVPDGYFLDKLPEVLHLACFICYVKEIPSYVCLSDVGIIHELIHLNEMKQTSHDTALMWIKERDIRKLFNIQCKLD